MEKAYLQIEGRQERFEVMFNPAEYNLSRGVNYAEKKIPGLESPVFQFLSGESESLELTLIFDTYKPPTVANGGVEGGTDVTEKTKELAKLLCIKGDLHRPPRALFVWGNLKFHGIATKIDENYTMFLPDGMPVRAKVRLTLQSYQDAEEGKKKTPLESPDRTKIRKLKEGEQLYSLAYAEYGDPGMWRVIAEENQIMNPLEVRVGRSLKLPAL